MFDITATIVFHHERAFALPALASLNDLVSAARCIGLKVEARAMLDKADDLTRSIVLERGSWLDAVEEVTFGDLGLTRNAGALTAKGEYLAFFDGDDLWGAEWLHLAYSAAQATGEDAIWHPECLYYFDSGDYDRHSITSDPHSAAQSFHFIHHPSNTEDFDRNCLFLNNVWSANIFAKRALHLRHPYKPVDKQKGFGVEDWSWNVETVWAGIPHYVVPETVHLIRLKETGSLGQQNAAEGLLPHIPDYARPRVGLD